MAVLSHQQILSLHAAVVSASLPSSRAALLGGMDPAFTDSLPICASPSSQIPSDLHALNAAERLRDGAFPITIWLANALALVGPRNEAEIFQSALAAAAPTGGITLARPEQRGDEIAEELTRIGRAVLLARGNDLKRSLYEVEALLARCPHHVEARLLRERLKYAVEAPVEFEERGLRAIRWRPMPSPSTRVESPSRLDVTVRPVQQYWRRESSFTGRSRELVKLKSQLRSGGVLITGLAGAGKTALALELFQASALLYPDLQICIDFKGSSRDILSPAAAMEKVVRAFLPEVPLPKGADEIAGLYHAVLQGQHTLLLFDDARDGAQIEPLLPPAGSVLVVTSRRRFALQGVRSMTLDRLEGKDARALLQHLAPRIDGDMVGDLAERCGGMPLALQLAGGALAMRLDISPEAYADRLHDAQARHEQIDAELSVSFDLLDPVLQILWSHLGFLTFDFCESDAVAVASGSFPAICEALTDLVAYGMLDYNSRTDLYAMPGAARRFALSRLSEEDRVEAERRCESLASSARDHRRAVGDAWLEGALAASRRSGYKQAEAVYLDRLSEIVNSRSVKLAEQAADIFRELGDRTSELRTLEKLMLFYTNIRDARRCIAICQQRLACVSELGDPLQQVRVSYQLSQHHEKLGELDKAIAAVQVGVDIGRDLCSSWSKKCENQLRRLCVLLKT